MIACDINAQNHTIVLSSDSRMPVDVKPIEGSAGPWRNWTAPDSADDPLVFGVSEQLIWPYS